jgi:hypothetical protein
MQKMGEFLRNRLICCEIDCAIFIFWVKWEIEEKNGVKPCSIGDLTHFRRFDPIWSFFRKYLVGRPSIFAVLLQANPG